MSPAAWFGVGYLVGGLPFSVWLPRIVSGADVRAVGDGNPGAANAWQAAGPAVGLAALALDFLKGVAPTIAARMVFGFNGLALAAVALAPILGHAFSPWLGFRGGKAIAVTFGVWTGLTLATGPLVLGLSMTVLVLLLSAEAWAVVLSLATLIAYLFLAGADTALLLAAGGNLALLAWTHRQGLRQAPRLRPSVTRWRRMDGPRRGSDDG